MEVLTILILFIGFVSFATLHWTAKQERDMYKELYDDAFGKATILIRENANLTMENRRLHQENTTISSAFYDVQRCAAKTPIKDDDIVYAVKYAMKKAHPDNGGKQEDFIKFNNLYNKIR